MWDVFLGAFDETRISITNHLQLKRAAYKYIWDFPFDSNFHYHLNGGNS